jgi:hypothetical protein
MENTVNKHDTTSAPKKLHPIWHRHFGVQTLQPSSLGTRQQNLAARDPAYALLRDVQALVATHGPAKHLC